MKKFIKKIIIEIFVRLFDEVEISHFCNDLQNRQIHYFVKKTKKKLPSAKDMLGIYKDE